MKHFVDQVGRDVFALTSMFDLAKDMIMLFEAYENTFRFIYVNRSALKQLNMGKEVVGKRLEELLPKELANVSIKKLQEVQTKRQAIEYTDSIETKSMNFIAEASLGPIMTESGECNFILAIVRDITSRIHKEKELLETKRILETSQKRLKSLVDNNVDAVFELDLNGNFIHLNEVVTALTGYSKQAILGKSFTTLIADECLKDTMKHFEKALDGSKEIYKTWIYTKEGQLVHIQVENIPIIVDDILVGVYGIAKDITEKNRAQLELIETKEELEIFWKYSVDPVFFINTNGDILKVNPAFEKTFEYSEHEVVIQKRSIVPDNMKLDPLAIDERIRNGETIISHETKRITKSGKLLDIISSYTPIRDKDRKVIGATVFYKDVTELKKTQRELLKSQEKYKLITENAFDIIMIVSPTGILEYVSPAYKKVLGYGPYEYIGQPYSNYIHPDDHVRVAKAFKAIQIGEEPVPIELRVKDIEGNYIWMESTTTRIMEDGHVKQLVTIARDITEKKQLSDELAKAAFYDYLSGLPNRRLYEERLEEAIDKANQTMKKVAVMMLDGRKFKEINDTFGHDAGDAVIKEMATRLQQSVRVTDTVARLGGDEMAIILPDINTSDSAIEIAKRIIRSFDYPFHFNSSEIIMGAGIGIAIYPDHTTSKKQLMKLADRALYKAKESEENTYELYR